MAAESVLAAASQSSLLLLPPPSSSSSSSSSSSFSCRLGFHTSSRLRISSSYSLRTSRHFNPLVTATAAARAVSADSKTPSTIITNNIDLATEGIEIEPEIGGGGGSGVDGDGDGDGDLGGRGGGGGGGGDNEGGGGEKEDSGDHNKKKMALSMSQKVTLGYAALVGLGGLMGYMKSGSQKSLLAGGVSASVLYYVYTQLPTNPVYASSIGLGISAALMGVMGSRFMKSKKLFPAGVVSLVSLIMTGGYLHGIMRSMH